MIDNPTFHPIKLSYTYCFLLQCNDGYLLIDTSYPNCFPRFHKEISRLGIDIKEIKWLLLTHHHDDHAGFAAELIKKAGCRVIVHKNALAPLALGKSEDSMVPVNRRVKFVFSVFTLTHQQFNFPPVTLGENDVIVEGDDFELLNQLGVNGKILNTPGHSGDSISVILSNGTAFVGDVAMNFLRFTGIKHRPIYIEDINTVYASWRKLIEHGAKTIYPAHGKPFPASELIW